MNGLAGANVAGASLTPLTVRQQQLTVSKVDNGFVIADFNNYQSPLQRVALDFDSMVTELREYFN